MVAPRPSAEPRAVGARVLRREDPRFLTGRGRYVSDVEPPSLLHAAFVRSPHAHARVTAVDRDAAVELPGVIAVLTVRDLDGLARPLRARKDTPGYHECDTEILARTSSLRFVSWVLVVVSAEGQQCARVAFARWKRPTASSSGRSGAPPTSLREASGMYT